MQCRMPAEDCRKRFTAKALQPVRDFAEIWFGHTAGAQITFHDPLAAACIFAPDICKYRQGHVAVSLNQPTMGWTVFDSRGEDKPHTVAAEVDPTAFFDHYFDVVR